jgi:hypothetical protein
LLCCGIVAGVVVVVVVVVVAVVLAVLGVVVVAVVVLVVLEVVGGRVCGCSWVELVLPQLQRNATLGTRHATQWAQA